MKRKYVTFAGLAFSTACFTAGLTVDMVLVSYRAGHRMLSNARENDLYPSGIDIELFTLK